MLNAARAYRRLKEIEEKKLENRLQLLKLEIDRSKAKIEETKARTKAIQAHKDEIERRNREKANELRRREEEIIALRLAHERSKEIQKQHKQAVVMTIEEAKRQEAARVYEERLKNEEEIRKQRELAVIRARQMRESIQQQYEEGKKYRESLMSQRKQQAEDTFRGKLASEAAASQLHEQRVVAMEDEERYLISELARAQEEQRKAYADLEAALAQTRQARMQHSPMKTRAMHGSTHAQGQHSQRGSMQQLEYHG